MKPVLKILLLLIALSVPSLADCVIEQSTSGTVKMGPFIDDDDFITAHTALTIQKASVRVSKNGGNMAAASADQGASDAGAPHDELGVYDISYNTTDSNTVGNLRFDIKITDALHVWQTCEVKATRSFEQVVEGLGSTIDDLNETDCSTIASSTSPMGKICGNKIRTAPSNTEYPNFTFRMFNSAGTAIAGLTVSCEVVKDGAAPAACTNAVSQIGSTTYYKTTIAATDLDVTQESYFRFSGAGVRDVEFKINVQH